VIVKCVISALNNRYYIFYTKIPLKIPKKLKKKLIFWSRQSQNKKKNKN